MSHAPTDPKTPSKPRERMPLFWDGMNVSAWTRLLVKNRFRLYWGYWYLLPVISALSVFHSAYRLWQWVVAGWRVKRKIAHSPLFILGHWRSGTTLLHELMVLDPRHTHPTTYECFAPNHFVITEWVGTRLFAFLVPGKRPMDNMPVSWHRPQEDEFALCNLGLPSPYLTIAFPNEPPQDQEYWTLADAPAEGVARWKKVFCRFLQEINFRAGGDKRIVLKSPPHTGRVKVLLEVFPDAKFVHIVRDPYVIFPSTVHLWKTLYSAQSLQKPTYAGLEDYVFENLVRMYERFEQDRLSIPAGNLCEVRYEELVVDMIGTVKRVYSELGLDGFEQVRPALEEYVAKTRGYETNKYRELPPELRAKISDRWRSYIERYGYTSTGTTQAGTKPGEENGHAPRGADSGRPTSIDAS